jgi:hypothetical protein
MLKTIPDPERARLDFPAAARASFAFLAELGFNLTTAEMTFVRYESPRVFVNVYHGRASYELNVEVGLRADTPSSPENPFSIGEIVELQSGGLRHFRPPQVTTADGVRKSTAQLAELVRDYAGEALRGDADFFTRLSLLRVKKSDAYLKDSRLSRVRAEADKAWRERDYEKFISLYQPLTDDLSPAELKKLSLAKKYSKHS